ncbi:MAG: N6-L-threonylcarbamoyladenine synthase [Thermoproteota archaeon]|jgi:N6-L-threonylcarbamoyladenine synthase
MTKLVLGIETSCDDTSICLLKTNEDGSPQILSHQKFSQELMLKKWGGVVPEIAARNHLLKLTPLLDSTFEQASANSKHIITTADVDLIGVTTTPGLLGPLLTGLNAAKTISLINQTPIIPINHLYAHLEAIHLTQKINYPYLGLLVSGGHSIYFLVSTVHDFQVLGSTIDDAAGEAFDKGGKMIGLGYPAGIIIDNFAKFGDPKRFGFPIGLRGSKNANLSFSGLKTSLRLFKEKNPELFEAFTDEELAKAIEAPEQKIDSLQNMYDVCASYQRTIVDTLCLKLKFAIKAAREILEKDCNNKNKLQIVVGGGVACNSELRTQLQTKYSEVYFVKPEYCTDNGAMIANYALRTAQEAVEFPLCLEMDARGRFINKTQINHKEGHGQFTKS